MKKIGGQNQSEWDDFIEYLQDKNVRSYLEVGAREGIALRYLVERLPTIESVTTVDLPGAEWGYPDTDKELLENLSALDCQTKAIFGDSKEVVDQAKGKYDLVFIDGDHTYEGVKADYENYGPMGRIVAFHDINQSPGLRAYGVTQLWNEIKTEDSVTFVSPKSRKGIGVC